MPKFTFDPEDVRRGFTIAKLVRPMTGDYVLRIVGRTLSVISHDRRRYCRADIQAKSTDVADDYASDEFFLSADRQSLFDAKLSSLTISVTDKALNIRAEEEKQSRQASIRRRPDNSRRPKVQLRPLPGGGTLVKAAEIEKLLHQVSCSAMVKETKTEEDMKVNQVHFYPDEKCAVSNARTYASAVTFNELALDLSIVSADIPLCRTFCSKSGSDHVLMGQSAAHLFLSDPSTGSYLLMSRVASARPPLFVLDQDGYTVEIRVEKNLLTSSLSWARTAIEGTSRLNLTAVRSADSNSGRLDMSANGQEIATLPITFLKGKEMRADFHVSVLSNVAGYIDGDDAILRYAHPKIPTLLEITDKPIDGEPKSVIGRHFLQCMRQH